MRDMISDRTKRARQLRIRKLKLDEAHAAVEPHKVEVTESAD